MVNNNHMFFKYEAAYRQSNLLTRTKMFEDTNITTAEKKINQKEVKPVVNLTTCCAPVC